jgi:hypothetical protein
MSAIPLHLQRRFEQRWAARFVSPATSAAPKNVSLKGSVNSKIGQRVKVPKLTHGADIKLNGRLSLPIPPDVISSK